MSRQANLLSIHRRIFRDHPMSQKSSSRLRLSAMGGGGMATMLFFLTNNNDQNSNYTTFTEAAPPTSAATAATTATTEMPSNKKNPHIGIIETDFMDKIASKSYLNYHNTFTHDNILSSAKNTTKKVWNRMTRSNDDYSGYLNPTSSYTRTRTTNRNNDSFDKDSVMTIVQGTTQLSERPKGVPRRIRVLAIDVPEFREVFNGECRVNLSRVYPDDVAPRKYIPRKIKINPNIDNDDGGGDKETDTTGTANSTQSNNENNNNNTNKSSNEKKKRKSKTLKKGEGSIEIVQKSLARSLVRCRNVHSKRIGVELLEASVYDLNPHNMRRTYQLGSYRYDPGKYGSMNQAPGNDMMQRRMTAYGGIQTGNPRDVVATTTTDKPNTPNGNDPNNNGNGSKNERTILASDEDEVDAPWNQYAWIEEMELRINGRIPFGANVERTSWITRKLFGSCYRTTVKRESSSPFLWFVPSFFVRNRGNGYEGIDGDYGKNRRTINRASSKPHAVIADGSAMQRVPGSLRYLSKCCQEADVPLFIINDPRVWGGNTHRDLESAAKDMRKTVKAKIVANALNIKEGSMFERGRKLGKLESETKWQLKDAGRRTREAVQSAAARLQKERDENWSELNSKELLNRLLERQVLRLEGSRLKDATVEEAFGELCRQYLASGVKSSNEEVPVESKGNSIVVENRKETSEVNENGNEDTSIPSSSS